MRNLLLAVLLLCMTPSCTLGKPFVCAVTAPPLLFEGIHLGGGCDPAATAIAVGGMIGLAAAVGLVSGLCTGFVSDVNVLTGRVDRQDAMNNIGHPFKTNDM